MKVVELKNVSFSYTSGKELFTNVNLSMSDGEVIVICGPSGCGKTTLCHLIAGIIPRSVDGIVGGSVELYGKSVSESSLFDVVSKVGVVFQNPDSQLFSSVVEGELAFGPENLNVEKSEIERRINYVLELVGMSAYRFSNPMDLSGGQKQLIALAAVLTMDPKVLIFDEALSQLDENSTNKIKECIRQLKNEGKTIIMVEHDEDNFDVADRIVYYEDKSFKENIYEK